MCKSLKKDNKKAGFCKWLTIKSNKLICIDKLIGSGAET